MSKVKERISGFAIPLFCGLIAYQSVAQDANKQSADSAAARHSGDAVLKRLQGEPVSVFDFGLEMMWRDLMDTAKDETMNYYGRDGAFPAYIGITYEPKEEKIWISIESNPGTEGGLPSKGSRENASAEGWCRTLINKLRANLAGYPNQPPRWLRHFVPGYGHSDFADLPIETCINDWQLVR